MLGWVERWRLRQRELAEGADQDLIQANRRRFRFAFGLIGLAFTLGVISTLHLPRLLGNGVRFAAGISGVAGVILGKWAQAERAMLTRPDQEGPPEIYKTS